MPVLWRGTQAEVGITGLFWIRLSSWPVFHSKSGPLCHPAHRGVMLSQQDILPPQHHPHPASTRHPFSPRKGTKLICFYTHKISVGSLILMTTSVTSPRQCWVKRPSPDKTDYILFGYFLKKKITFALHAFGFYVQKLLEETSKETYFMF